MELALTIIQLVIRFLVFAGIVGFFLWFEKWMHENLFPKTWQNQIGNNSDLMHIIAISTWVAIVSTLLFIAF